MESVSITLQRSPNESFITQFRDLNGINYSFLYVKVWGGVYRAVGPLGLERLGVVSPLSLSEAESSCCVISAREEY